MPDKVPNMVAAVEKRRPGRPKKFNSSWRNCHITLPHELLEAAEQMRLNRKLPDFSDGVRELMWEGAERNGLVEPRK